MGLIIFLFYFFVILLKVSNATIFKRIKRINVYIYFPLATRALN